MRGFKPAHGFNYYVRVCFVKYLIKSLVTMQLSPSSGLRASTVQMFSGSGRSVSSS